MTILKQRSSGPLVRALQQRLSDLGFDPRGIDGTFGPGTLAAVIAFQKSKGLQADGIVGPLTATALQINAVAAAAGGGMTRAATAATPAPASTTGAVTGSKTLNANDYQEAATLLNSDVPAIKAVAEVESSGAGFLPDGRPKILFERHKFHKFTNGKYDATHPGISQRTPGGYGAAGSHQWDRFNEAAALDRNAAIQACSWGKFQVMGFNFEICGFASLADFFAAMQKDEGEHLKAFCNFIKANNLAAALRNHQWAKLAAGYNGANYKINNYDKKLAAAFKKYSSQ